MFLSIYNREAEINLAAKLLQKGVELGDDDVLLGAESGIVGKTSGVEHDAVVHVRKHLNK